MFSSKYGVRVSRVRNVMMTIIRKNDKLDDNYENFTFDDTSVGMSF